MRFYTETDLEELMKLTELQAKALMRDKTFPSKKIGQTYLVEESALAKWFEDTGNVKLDYSGIYRSKKKPVSA